MRVDITRTTEISRSMRARQLEAMFDVPGQPHQTIHWEGDVPIEARPWNIGLIVGPSGSGKSSILAECFGKPYTPTWRARSVIDDFPSEVGIEVITAACQAVGFNTIPAWLRPHAVLSNGERFRADWNTMSMADARADASGHQVIIRHTGDVNIKLEQAKETLSAIRSNAADWQAIATQMAAVEISADVVTRFVADFIPMPDGAQGTMRTNRETARAAFDKLYNSPFTATEKPTAYRLFQAATEYLDHVRRYKTPDTYLTRTLVKPQKEKAAALAAIRKLVPALAA